MVKKIKNVSHRIDIWVEFIINMRKLMICLAFIFILLSIPIIPIFLFILSINQKNVNAYLASENPNKDFSSFIEIPSDTIMIVLMISILFYVLLHFLVVVHLCKLSATESEREKNKVADFISDSQILIIRLLVSGAFILGLLQMGVGEVMWQFLNMINPDYYYNIKSH